MRLPFKYSKQFIALLDQGIVSGTNFCLGILITRFSGVETYGQFAIFWMVYLFLQGLSIAYVGLPMQVLSQNKKNKNEYLEQSIQLSNTVLLTILPLIIAGMYTYSCFETIQNIDLWFWLFPFVIVLFVKHDVHRKYFYSKHDTTKVLILDAIGYFFQTPTLLVLSFYTEITLNEILITLLATISLSNVAFYFLKDQNNIPYSFNNLPFKENFNYAKHLLTTNILQWFSGNYLIIIAAAVLGNGAVGVIKIFQNLMGVLNVLFSTLENIIPPKAAYLFNEGGKKALFTYMKKVVLFVGSGYLLILGTIKIFGKEIIQFTYGNQYTEHSYLINYFLIVYVFVFIGTVCQIIIKTLQLNFSIFIAYVLTMIITAIIANPLVTNYGVLGVVYGLIILQIVTISTYLLNLKFSKI